MFYGSLFAGKLFQGGLFMGGLSRRNTLAALIAALFGNDEQGGLWLPGLDTCYTDNGTTLCTTPGQLVYRIDDLSGNGNHAIQATEAARPALQQTEGGLWYLAFDMIDDQLFLSNVATSSIHTLFFGYHHLGVKDIVGLHTAGIAGAWSLVAINGSTSAVLGLGTESVQRKLRIDAVLSTDTTRGQQFTRMVAGNVAVQEFQTISPGWVVNNKIIGKYFGGDVHLAERVFGYGIVNRALTADETSQVETILAARSGVTLP